MKKVVKNESTLVCSKCGSENVETKAWVDVNDDTVLDGASEGNIEDNWCRDCEEHVSFMFKHDKVKYTPYQDPNNRGGTGYYDESLSDADPGL